MLISDRVTVPTEPVQLPLKMKDLEPPALYRGLVELLTPSQVKQGL